MTCIDLTGREKICCFTHFSTPKLKVPDCSEETSRFTSDHLDYIAPTSMIDVTIPYINPPSTPSLEAEMF